MKVWLLMILCACCCDVYCSTTSKDESVACIKCGSIQGCDCRANEKYPECTVVSGGTRWDWSYNHASFVHSSNTVQKVLVPRFALPRVGYVIQPGGESFPSIVKMPQCKTVRNGYVFSKWQQVGAITNTFYSVGDTVKVSSNTVFAATWCSTNNLILREVISIDAE